MCVRVCKSVLIVKYINLSVIYLSIYLFLITSTQMRTYVCMHVCMNVCMYVSIYLLVIDLRAGWAVKIGNAPV